MRSVLKEATLLAAVLLVFAGGTASAAVVVVKVPFPFVVQGRQFPAGEYRLQRDATDSSVVLIQGEKEKHRQHVRVDDTSFRTGSGG